MPRAFLWAAILVALSCPAPAAELVLRDQYKWTFEDPNFGGFSGLSMAPDGQSFLAISDRGYFARAQITRADGGIAGISTDAVEPLPLVRDRDPVEFLMDAEGLAVAPDGTIYVSYEGHHRVWTFDADLTKANWTHTWNFFWRFQSNSGLEALAVDADGTVYAIPERSGKWERPFPVFRYKDDTWDDALSIPRSKRFLVVGADFGPDGKLYVLERDFDIINQFKSRIRRFSLSEDGFDQGETLLETKYSVMENAEGISLWTDASGQTIVTLISDDNFLGLLSTWVTEYELRE